MQILRINKKGNKYLISETPNSYIYTIFYLSNVKIEIN